LQSRHQARLELNRASAEVEEIQEMADRTLKLIRVEIAALEYAVVQARARQQRLMDAGEKYRLERQLEDSAREVFLARNQLDRAREGLQKDRYTWEINIRQARHGLVMAQERYNRTVLRAPSEGTVLHIHRKTGEAAAGPLVSIADLSRMIVIADVAETDIGKISPGMRATATARAFPDELTGEVFSVDRWIDGNTQIGKVYIRLTRAVPANRFINMQVSVTIHTAR
jgi:multidrug resistance efflux pump